MHLFLFRFLSSSRRTLFFFILILLVTTVVPAQQRREVRMNSGWQFRKGTEVLPLPNDQWQPVQLPHSWNTTDVMDDEPGYYRGVGWYRKLIATSMPEPEQQLYLKLEGANQVCTVYVNGQLAGQHTGGYTAMQVDITPYCRRDSTHSWNELLIKVDNSHNPQVPPLSADFTFFGGLYRDVWLVTVPAVHFEMAATGNVAVYVHTPQVSTRQATVAVKGSLLNKTTAARKIELRAFIQDSAGKQVTQASRRLSLKAGERFTFDQALPVLNNPELWNPDRPYLYSITTQLVDVASGRVIDQVSNPLGLRWYRFDADSGFYLNGQRLKLIGASRHQDRPGIGNAVPDELALQDMYLLKQTGANFLRVAHYPHDPSVLEACDRLGILASVEIPVVNEITESDSFYNNCLSMQREMIHQYFNHSSVIMWCYMNEILLRPRFNDDKERQQQYFRQVTRLARRLDSLTRAEDKERYTFMACHGDFDRYHQTGLTRIPMVLGWNLYSGWYGGVLANFPSFLEKHHQLLPQTPLVVSEYGADADPRIRSLQPVRFDKSVEYTTRFHQFYWNEIKKRAYVAAAMVWNLADFNSETREETMPHINNKGLLTWDRVPKDPYYFYQAAWQSRPVLKILAANWNSRTAYADSNNNNRTTQPVQVAANFDAVELFVNGYSMGRQTPVDYIAEWNVPFENGETRLEVKAIHNGEIYTDNCNVEYSIVHQQPGFKIPEKGLHVLLGANRYFIDNKTGITWIPGREYIPGGWGAVGGNIFRMTNNNRLPYGSDKAIAGTDNDPVYQTQLTGIEGYRLNLPPGSYELTLHFSELQGAAAAPLAYNLSTSNQKDKSTARVFDIWVNGMPVVEKLDLATQYGVAAAVSIATVIEVKGAEGIYVQFKPVTGEPVLNALEVQKKY